MTVTTTGSLYLNVSLSLGSGGPGSVQGLLGSDSGQASDFALPDGTVLTQPSAATILGAYATAWSVAPDQSLLQGVAPISVGSLGLGGGMAFTSATQAGEVLTGSLGAVVGDAGYQGVMSALAGDVLAGFAAGDRVDVTDLGAGGAALAFTPGVAGGVLMVTNGAETLRLGVQGLSAGVGFALRSDGHGGTMLTAVGAPILG